MCSYIIDSICASPHTHHVSKHKHTYVHTFIQQRLIELLLFVSMDYWLGSKHSLFPVANHDPCSAELLEQL